MAIWYQMGYFHDDLEVKRVCEKEYTKLSTRKEITEKKPSPPQLTTDSSKPETYIDTKIITTEYDEDDSLTQKAYFNVRTGRFENVTGKSHWEKYNIPSNHEDRLMNHYFDLEGYQEYMRSKSNEGTKKRKVTRKQIEYFKKRKVERRLKKILQN